MLGIVGFFLMPATQRRVAVALAAVVACQFALLASSITNVHGWTGGWTPAARFLTPIVPLLALPMPLAIAQMPRPLTATVIAVQIVISAYMWQNPKNLWNDGDGIAAVCERGGATFCRFLPSFPPD